MGNSLPAICVIASVRRSFSFRLCFFYSRFSRFRWMGGGFLLGL